MRIQSMNGANIGLFQYDYDLTLMIFFMDADDHFYARYGGRNDEDAESYLTQPSLVRVMKRVLELHKTHDVQTSRYEPADPPVRTPEDIPTMAAQMAPRREKCIHCHDVKVAGLRDQINRGTFRKEMVFTYPTPLNVGIEVNPDAQDEVKGVKPGSPAAEAGIAAGDELLSADGQRILSVGDFARVLELTPKQATLPLELKRNGKPLRKELHLTGDWKRTDDASWRASVNVAGPNGGFWAVELNEEQKRELHLKPDQMGLRITVFFPPRESPAVKAGLQLKDVIVAYDGHRERMATRQVHAYTQLSHNYGDSVPVVVLRDGKELTFTLRLPEHRSQPGD